MTLAEILMGMKETPGTEFFKRSNEPPVVFDDGCSSVKVHVVDQGDTLDFANEYYCAVSGKFFNRRKEAYTIRPN